MWPRIIAFINQRKNNIHSVLHQIAYNAEGDMLIPFVLHKPDFQQVLIRHFEKEINFFATDDGNLDRNCLCIILYIISL